ncbi:MAG: hypothetical protein LBJ58_03190, partial [Tannerellaceae bacterium]|nr:hypothetical protein [Tannerellaceae bacterium]
MANSVSNDALWEKLSEISEQLKSNKQMDNAPDFCGVKDEILAEIKEEIRFLGKHSDVNFGTVNQNIATLDEKVGKVWNIVARIRKQQKEPVERQSESDTEQRLEVLETQAKGNREYFNFRFFKLRKTSVVIAILGLLVFILILFCMKQQNDYTLLNNEYYRQRTTSEQVKVEIDSLRNAYQ